MLIGETSFQPPPLKNDVYLTFSDRAETWWGGVVEGADYDGEVGIEIRCEGLSIVHDLVINQ